MVSPARNLILAVLINNWHQLVLKWKIYFSCLGLSNDKVVWSALLARHNSVLTNQIGNCMSALCFPDVCTPCFFGDFDGLASRKNLMPFYRLQCISDVTCNKKGQKPSVALFFTNCVDFSCNLPVHSGIYDIYNIGSVHTNHEDWTSCTNETTTV